MVRFLQAHSQNRHGPGTPRLKKIEEFRVTPAEAASSDNRILILRNPVDRIVSTWLQKFLCPQLDKGSLDEAINLEAEKITGLSAKELDFETFVRGYVNTGVATDVHLKKQISHLGNIRYNRVVTPSQLGKLMSIILGPRTAAYYFLAPHNRSCDLPKPALSKGVVEIIKTLYEEDYELLASIRYEKWSPAEDS